MAKVKNFIQITSIKNSFYSLNTNKQPFSKTLAS